MQTRGKRKILTVIALIVILSILLVLILNLDNWFSVGVNDFFRDDTVIIGNYKYKQKKLSTFLVIGVDDMGSVSGSDSYNNTQQADFLMLISFDRSENKYSILHINRDTMTSVDVLGVGGYRVGERTEQIALAHTYGDGTTSSCLNTVRAVSKMLFGLTIDHYIMMTMSAVEALNDYIAPGGLPVTFNGDYTEIDERYTNGATVNLRGSEALRFVRNRVGLNDSSNIARMERQKVYINSLINYISTLDMTDSFITGAYRACCNDEHSYVLFDSFNDFYNMMENMSKYKLDGIYSPEGYAIQGAEFMEFYADERSLERLATALYYEKAK